MQEMNKHSYIVKYFIRSFKAFPDNKDFLFMFHPAAVTTCTPVCISNTVNDRLNDLFLLNAPFD